MKVLQIINSLNTGGAEKLLLETIPEYRERGIDMELLLLDGTEHPFLKALRAKSDVKIHCLKRRSIYNPIAIFGIRRYLKAYDVIHVHLFPALYWTALAKVFSGSGAKMVFTEHNTTNGRREVWWNFVDRWMYRPFTRLVTISYQVDINLKTHLKSGPEKFVMIHNGVPVHRIGATAALDRKALHIVPGARILIQVSSFTRQKDQPTLIRALALLPQEVIVLLVGDGTGRTQVEALAMVLGVADRVQFLGIRMDVNALLRMSDIVVLSSHYEGQSLSCIEGMASGRPLIASAAPGLTQVVEGAGLLFPIGDAEALADRIRILLTDQEAYNAVTEKCLKRASEYSLDRMVDAHIKLYQQLCQNQN